MTTLFFDLGCPLPAAVLTAQLTERFGVKLPPRQFFGRPTVSAVDDYRGDGHLNDAERGL